MDQARIRLVVSDIDGTLVRHDKTLPEANIAAIRGLLEAGVAVSLISARPPAGILPIAASLGLEGPFGAFNGGTVFTARGAEGEAFQVAADLASRVLALFVEARVDRWQFATDRWLTNDAANPHTSREVLSSGLQPQEVADFAPWRGGADKIVAICDDPAAMDRLEAATKALAGGEASVVRSQPYYLDVTALQANKGDGLTRLAHQFAVPLESVAVLGDQANDVAMFRRAGLSVVMGQAPDAVKREAQFVAASNEEGGVADAISRFILPRI